MWRLLMIVGLSQWRPFTALSVPLYHGYRTGGIADNQPERKLQLTKQEPDSNTEIHFSKSRFVSEGKNRLKLLHTDEKMDVWHVRLHVTS